jgi:hypothetical protein
LLTVRLWLWMLLGMVGAPCSNADSIAQAHPVRLHTTRSSTVLYLLLHVRFCLDSLGPASIFCCTDKSPCMLNSWWTSCRIRNPEAHEIEIMHVPTCHTIQLEGISDAFLPDIPLGVATFVLRYFVPK